jgi:electron transport complex protein RnfA
MISWALNTFALVPLKLEFMQIIAFIGIVACLVQATDLILKKVNPLLHKKFGIYLVLITTNCIILAVPLLNATNGATMLQAFGLSLGAGLGFALALFLMSCAIEKVNMAPVPLVFKGLPIAFIIAGLFALSFLGFSGLKVA